MFDLRKIFVLISLALLIGGVAFSQAVNGTIVGTVTDASGAVIAGAKITLTEVNTKIVHTGTTNSSGEYSFPDLPPGTYDVAAEMSGFKKEVKSGTVLEANNSPRVDMKLQTGDVTQTVEVSASAATLQTERADTGREFVHGKWLYKVVVPASFKPPNPLVDGGKRAHDQHRNSYAFLSQGLDHRQAVYPHEHAIDDQERGRMAAGCGKPLRLGSGDANEIAKIGQLFGDFRRHFQIIVDEQDWHVLKTPGHRSFSVLYVLLRFGQMVQDWHREPSSRRWRQQL